MALPIAIGTAVPQTIAFGSLPQLVQLDGSSSYDPDVFPITDYLWTLIYKPPGSAAALSSTVIVNPTFTADVQGSYMFFLQVTSSDPGDGNSEPVMRNAPDSALVEATVETENFDWSIPAQGSRAWQDRIYEIFTEIDTSLGVAAGVSHTYARTDADTARFIVQDTRTVGAPFATSDYLFKFSNKNAAGHTGENERGGIQLDMEQADSAEDSSFAFEQTDGDGFAVLTGTPWRGLLMTGPVPTGTEVPTMLQLGISGSGVVNAQALRAFWDESGTNVLQLWKTQHSGSDQSILELTEELDVDAAVTTQYYILKPSHVTPASTVDQRLRLERTRLMLRRELFVHTKNPADSDFDKNWRIRIWRDGEVAADQPELGWDEDAKTWQVKGVGNTDVVVHGTGTSERTRMEHGQLTITNNTGGTTSKMTAFVAYDRAFASIPDVLGSLLGSDPNTEEQVGAVYFFPRGGNTLTQLKVEVNAQVGQTFLEGEHVTVTWLAIGHDTE